MYKLIALALTLAGLTSAQTLTIPSRVGSVTSLPSPSVISGSVDLGNREYDRGRPCDSDEDTGDENAVFILNDGASLSNVIIGANQLEGIHCKGSCTLKNVWFRDVCEDAISILGTGNALIQGGGAQEASDKVVQHNGKGTVTIDGFTVVNAGKLYRSCGNCSSNKSKSPRKVIIKNVKARGVSNLVGINSNYGDTASVSNTCGSSVKVVCQEYKGVEKSDGVESSKLSTTSSCSGQLSLSSASLLFPTKRADTWGGSVSLGPTKSTITNAVTTLIPGAAPATQNGVLFLWPGMSNGTGDLIQATLESWQSNAWCGAQSGEWCVRASVFGSFGQLDGDASPVAGDDQVRIEYDLQDDNDTWLQTVTNAQTGAVLSTYSHKSGPYMRGYGTGTECNEDCTGTIAAQQYVGTTITLASADTTFGNTIASAGGATYSGLTSSDGGKVWHIESINVPAMS
ncbi:hypothetical protein FE257_001288 [Aspergillus nanangensis]|uniref:Probable pectate lyase F n=1 Tax=Aspergillus nanangensis TaxID=2582783 RepID=A0AAD4GPQ7_ASPNN|nr:hypothetical protein FE257_001288 [Aspergillus nanangensis]